MIAVLVIDMQKDFFRDQFLKERQKTLVAEINSVIGLARARKYPIIWVRQEFEPDLSDAFLVMRRKKQYQTIRGTEGIQLVSGLDYRAGDHEIIKKRYSAFFKTDLEALLSTLRIETLVITGINTHACIRTTAIDAYQRDMNVIIPRTCISSSDEEHHRVSLKYMDDRIAQVVDSWNAP